MDSEYRQLRRTVQELRRQRDAWLHTERTMQHLLNHLAAKKQRLYSEQQQISKYTERVLDGLLPVVQRMQRYDWPAPSSSTSSAVSSSSEGVTAMETDQAQQPLMTKQVETRQDVIEYLNRVKLAL